MSSSAVSRPMPLSRVWSGEKILAEDLTGDDLGDVLELNAGAHAWWVLPRDDPYGEAELRGVAKALDLDELALKDLLAQDRRAKFEQVGQALLVVTNVVHLDRTAVRLMVTPVSIICTDRVLICLTNSTPDFQPAQLLDRQQRELALGGTEVALQFILHAVIDSYEVAQQFLEEAGDELANVLFEERPLDRSEQLHAFKLRTALSQLRRLTEPMRAVMGDLPARRPDVGKGRSARRAAIDRRWRVLHEQHQRVANATDALREALASVFDTSLALADVRMNQVMKKLSAWAAIIAVPTFVTSFVGMNVNFPFFGTVAGFLLATVVILVAAVVLYRAYKRRDWI